MKLEQVFYGRGAKGYAILGASVPDCGLTDCVQDLCGAVGTPGVERPGEDSPFLLQKHVGDSLVMVCGRKGEPDSLGRGTLLFHALIADRVEARKADVSAFVLFKSGLFSDSPKIGSIECVMWDEEGMAKDKKDCSLVLPAAVKCHRHENMEALAHLGDRLCELNWVSFSWKPLSDFDYQAIDVSCGIGLIPTNINVYDVRGSQLRKAGVICENPVGQSSNASVVDATKPGKRFWGEMIGAAILLGLGFVIGWMVTKLNDNETPISQVRTIKEPLRPTFDERLKIVDFDEGIKKICLPRDRSGEFVKKLRAYVDFVNRECIISTDQKGEK